MRTKAGLRADKAAPGPTDPLRPTKGAISVSVVYAEPSGPWQANLTVPAGATVSAVLRLSGFAQAFPDYPLESPAVGIFGRRCPIDQEVAEGDRIELYRTLNFDPMASRRRRAAHRKAAELQQKEFRPRRARADKI